MNACDECAVADVTGLLRRWSEGDAGALEQLVPLVYGELRRIARAYLAREAPGRTLQGTALVHEAYLRLVGQQPIDWRNRAQFFGIAAQTMRRILVEKARQRQAGKRGGGSPALSIECDIAAGAPFAGSVDILQLDDALAELAAMDPRRARVVEMRFFGGLTELEIAALLDVSEPTVRRDWAIAKAWLYRKMTGEGKKPRAVRAGS